MGYSENKARYNMEYAKKALKRIPLDVQKEKYAEIQAAAQNAGESVNGYIKKAIDERMERDSCTITNIVAEPEPQKKTFCTPNTIQKPTVPTNETLNQKLERLRSEHTTQ